MTSTQLLFLNGEDQEPGMNEITPETNHPDPRKDPKNEAPQYEPITTLGKRGGNWGAPFLDPLVRGSGKG